MLKVLTARHTLLCWRLRKTKLRRVSLSRQIKWRRLPILPCSCYGKMNPPTLLSRKLQQCGKTCALLQVCHEFFSLFFALISTPKSEKRDKYKLAAAACAHMIGSGVSVFQKGEHITEETDCGRSTNDTPSNQAERVI